MRSGMVKAKFEDVEGSCKNVLHHSVHQNHLKFTPLLHHFTEKTCKIMRK